MIMLDCLVKLATVVSTIGLNYICGFLFMVPLMFVLPDLQYLRMSLSFSRDEPKPDNV